MTKIDRLLYGGFAIVALGVVVAMLVSVFSPSKPVVEESVEPPQTEQATMKTTSIVNEPAQPENGTGEYWFDENGNKVWTTQEQIAESDAYEAELKRQEEEQRALDEAEKEWWESRQDWVDRFPFEPTPHPEITFDPTVYDPRKAFRGEWPQEKKNKAYWEMMRRVEHHSLLKDFYDSWVRYTEEFEHLHDIVQEELGEVGSTVALAVTFRTLAKYHKAAQRDPDSIYRENVRVELPKPEPVNTMVALGPEFYSLPLEKQIQISNELIDAQIEAMRANNTQKYEVRDVTWAERTERLATLIIGPLVNQRTGWEGIPKEQAIAIRDRLINEIPAAGFLELPELIWAYNGKYMGELKPGDPLLVK